MRSSRPLTAEGRIVIVGNGMVSQRLCEALTSEGPSPWKVVVVGEEHYPAYDRIHLSTVDEPASALISDEAWYARRGIELRLDCRAISIERAPQQLVLANGEALSYDALVLATGSAARMPEIAGINLPKVFSYRTLDDVLRIREALCDAKRAVIVGGGLLGLEAGRLALDARCDTTLIEASNFLMPRQLDAPSAAVLQKRVEQLGIRVTLDARLQAIESTGSGLRVRLAGDATLDADVVVVAIGVVPRDELARSAELKVAARGGVIVDDEMRTSDPRIYAVGDCVCHRGRSYGLVAPGLAMAEVVASRFQGKRARFAGGDFSCELKVLGIPVAAVGNYEVDALAVSASMPDGRRSLLMRGGRLIGATAVGAWDEVARVRGLAEREEKLSRRMLARFERTGRLFPDDEPGVASWPAAAIVCNCRRITKGELQTQMQTCGADAEALARCTGAGGVCGSCKPLLIELVGNKAAQPARVPYTRALSRLAFGVIALGLTLLSVRALPFASSVQDPWHVIDVLRVRSDYRQITGFTIAGLALLSTVISLRKRLGWFARASFGGFRALHAFLGALSLVALLAHTGLSVGHGFNAALMIVFAAAAIVGALAAQAASSETSIDARSARLARRARTPFTLLHILLLWPLPVLLGIHVLAAYYF